MKEHVDFVSPLAHYPLLPYCNNDFGNSPKTLDHLRVHSACLIMIVDGCVRVHVDMDSGWVCQSTWSKSSQGTCAIGVGVVRKYIKEWVLLIGCLGIVMDN